MNASLLLLDDTWVLRLLANHIGYVSFAIPVTILFIISKKAAYNHCEYCQEDRQRLSAEGSICSDIQR